MAGGGGVAGGGTAISLVMGGIMRSTQLLNKICSMHMCMTSLLCLKVLEHFLPDYHTSFGFPIHHVYSLLI